MLDIYIYICQYTKEQDITTFKEYNLSTPGYQKKLFLVLLLPLFYVTLLVLYSIRDFTMV